MLSMHLRQSMLTLAIITKHGESFVTKSRKLASLSTFRQKRESKQSPYHSTSTIKMCSNSPTNRKTQSGQNLQCIFGGDYAGQSATFSSTTGKLIPVPEHYVPDSMVEWGQIPSCFEVLVSEDFTTTNDDDNKIGLNRCTVQVMPEVGCGLDNLDTMKSKEFIPANACLLNGGDDVQMPADIQIGSVFIPEKNRVECVFTVRSQVEEKSNGHGNENLVRTRVGVNFFPNKLQIKSPIDIVKETKTSHESSKGSIADGGGLQSSRVAQLVGVQNINKPFSEGQGVDLNIEMVGSWTKFDTRNKHGVTIERHGEYWEGSDGQKLFSLPGHVIIEYNEQSPLSLEISLIVRKIDSDSLKRIVMMRNFQIDEADSIVELSAQHYWEEKM